MWRIPTPIICQYSSSGGQLQWGNQHIALPRSEERRVGKECRSRWSPYHSKKNKRNTLHGNEAGLHMLNSRSDQQRAVITPPPGMQHTGVIFPVAPYNLAACIASSLY